MLRNASQVREVVRAESKPIYLRATVGFGLPAGKAVDISETIKVTDAEVDVVDGDRPSWSMGYRTAYFVIQSNYVECDAEGNPVVYHKMVKQIEDVAERRAWAYDPVNYVEGMTKEPEDAPAA